ncbi:hypothetical protein BDP27DRAFT_145033 [Rhodocollybia butyracea]|uniref:Uncharacterized protein n=1 Tax=Rhodocollybia butyracea TaxID=206335 RepID=A0A9P5Q4K1_9AGAR|nr:hypothetical protein BDP27DRAFT_145033 [Rhodocollybia butyracea]
MLITSKTMIILSNSHSIADGPQKWHLSLLYRKDRSPNGQSSSKKMVCCTCCIIEAKSSSFPNSKRAMVRFPNNGSSHADMKKHSREAHGNLVFYRNVIRMSESEVKNKISIEKDKRMNRIQKESQGLSVEGSNLHTQRKRFPKVVEIIDSD